MYYVISLTHTNRHEYYITLWRPNNAGYCYSRDQAGTYEDYKPGYHENEGNMVVTTEKLEPLFQKVIYDGKEKEMIPNTKEFWDKLSVKMTKNGLKRK